MGFLKALSGYWQKNKKKIPTLIKISQIHPLGVFKPPEHKSGNEKSLRWTIEGLQVDFSKIFNFAAWPWNNSYGGN